MANYNIIVKQTYRFIELEGNYEAIKFNPPPTVIYEHCKPCTDMAKKLQNTSADFHQ